MELSALTDLESVRGKVEPLPSVSVPSMDCFFGTLPSARWAIYLAVAAILNNPVGITVC